MIQRNQFKGLNFKKIKKYQKEIEQYDGEIPIVLYNHINIGNRIKYLNSINQQYEHQHIQEYRKNKNNKIEKNIQSIIKWVNENPQFEDIIKI